MAFKACLVPSEDNKPGIGMQYVFNHKADWVDASKFGVHAKYKREGSRINYKKTIFWYFILSIQYYNK